MTEINTLVLIRKPYTIWILTYLILGQFFTLWLVILHIPFAITGSLFCILYIPLLIWSKRFRKHFTKDAIMIFSDNILSISILGKSNEIVEEKDEILFTEITSFKPWTSRRDDSAGFTINKRDGGKLKYTFIEQGTDKGETDVIEAALNSFIEYNKTCTEQDRIALISSDYDFKRKWNKKY